MENMYISKRDKNLNFILPDKSLVFEKKRTFDRLKIGVILHLHYVDTIKYYLEYIKNIPKYIDIIVTTSEKRIEKMIQEVDCLHSIKIIMKNNRGRDISSFLVACREIILEYDYICFTHDKGVKQTELYEDTKKFVRCIWENTLSSPEYINNVIFTFLEYPHIGLLVPPVPVLENITAGYRNIKKNECELMQKLANRIKLNVEIDINMPIITLGTAYWAKVDALKKIFEEKWKYEDFDEEPLADNGTISHAIERILSYIAWDAGYETGWVMTTCYAGEYIEELYGTLRNALIKMDEKIGIDKIYKLNHCEEIEKELLEFCERYKKIYIYGMGIVAHRCLKHIKTLQNKKIIIDAFLVSEESQKNKTFVSDIPVYVLKEQFLTNDCGIIIAVSVKNQNILMEKIKTIKKEFSNFIYYT